MKNCLLIRRKSELVKMAQKIRELVKEWMKRKTMYQTASMGSIRLIGLTY
jgi:hypothetical protein